MQQLLSQETWENVFNTYDSNISTNNFITILENCIAKATTILKITNKNEKLKPWITTGITQAIKRRDKMKKNILINNNKNNNVEQLIYIIEYTEIT